MLSSHIFRAYDIRGIYGKDFDEEGAYLIGKGFAAFLLRKSPNKKLTVVTGRDGRLSGKTLLESFQNGLLESGVDVMDIGMIPSPMLYFAISEGGYDGGITITASHNPKEYNGIKLQRDHAHSVCGEDIQKVMRIIEEREFVFSEKRGVLREEDFRERYFSKLRSLISFQRKKRPTIVIDAGNGIAGTFSPAFFRSLGCEVIDLFCEVDGNFPNHDADPEREENLRALKEQVIALKADFGIAFDGDGDRVGLVDEKGRHYSADLLLLLLARDILKRNPGAPIVYDLKSTEVLTEEIKKCGGVALMCKTGHSFVEEMMEKHGALLGGEVSGHLFIAENYYGFDDALLASARLIEIIWDSKKPIAGHLKDLPKTFVTPEIKVKIEEEKKFEIMERIREHFLIEYPDALTIDGIRIDFGEGVWGIVRASNTSPYLTTRFEARSEEKLKEIQRIAFRHLETYPEISGIPSVD